MQAYALECMAGQGSSEELADALATTISRLAWSKPFLTAKQRGVACSISS